MMNKKYMLIGVGGMNGEIWNLIGKYDSLEEVFELGYLDGNDVANLSIAIYLSDLENSSSIRYPSPLPISKTVP